MNWRWLKNICKIKKEDYGLDAGDSNFSLVAKNKRFEYLWEEILYIKAFKRDLLTSDMIILEIHLSNGESILIGEEMGNFNSFKDLLTIKLSLNCDWWSRVLVPPFELSETIVYQRSMGSDNMKSVGSVKN